MAHAKNPLSFAALALTGLVACGGSNQQAAPAQAPEGNTTTTTGSTLANAPTVGAGAAPDQAGIGTTSMNNNASTPPDTTKTGLTTNGPQAGIANPSISGTPGTSPTTTSSPSFSLSDAEIAAIVDAANTGEIEQAREAVKKAKNPKVKQLAQHMITDHTAAQSKQKTIDTKASITPQEGALSNQLKSDGSQIMSTLRSASGADFDKAYVDAQVTEHQTVLDTLDSKLLPQAQNAALKTFLQEVRTKVAHHLQMAKDIQSSLHK